MKIIKALKIRITESRQRNYLYRLIQAINAGRYEQDMEPNTKDQKNENTQHTN